MFSGTLNEWFLENKSMKKWDDYVWCIMIIIIRSLGRILLMSSYSLLILHKNSCHYVKQDPCLYQWIEQKVCLWHCFPSCRTGGTTLCQDQCAAFLTKPFQIFITILTQALLHQQHMTHDQNLDTFHSPSINQCVSLKYTVSIGCSFASRILTLYLRQVTTSKYTV